MKGMITSALLRKFFVSLLTPVFGALNLAIVTYGLEVVKAIFIEGYDPWITDVKFMLLGVPLFSYIFIFMIGFPVSFISDLLTFKLSNTWRMSMAFLIHTTGSLVAVVFVDYYFYLYFALPFSIIFWVLDEYLRRKKRRLR
ncbi:hypothetical protein IC620_09645 [Hazenella sp. IB182357]|uniref:Uncharacterized protein n=1 Tax=Polycladospora coralii TaxID=2771432 RepID=A0A926RUI8_9BACL|nr:hypothetical protein [Polycladospora coralii]MBD1372617.1 hypothetical protein [Polycladospora coralii]